MNRTAVVLKHHSQAKNWPYIVIFVGLGVGATGPILIRLAQSEGIPSLAVVAIRQILSTLFLTPVVLLNYRHELRQLALRDLIFAGLTGIVVALRFVLLFEAYNNISILLSGVFNGSGPLWVALVEIVFLKATFDRRIWLGLAMAVAGGAIIGIAGFDGGTSLGNNPTLGALYALSSAALSAIYFNVGRSLRARVSLWPYLWLIFLFAAFASLVASAASGTYLTGYSAKGYLWLFLLTIVAQFFGHGAINFALVAMC